jgi:endonuclease/exonuclease/phosphatase family metal-dependent hydrolase
MGGQADFCVASFNVHAGVDGWGRRFDVVAACRRLEADVLVVQEVWEPDDGPSMADALAHDLGATAVWHPMTTGRRAVPHPDPGPRWAPTRDVRTEANALYFDSERPLPERYRRTDRYRDAEPGTWGLAVLSRLPVRESASIDLGRLRGDRSRRGVVVVEVSVGGTPVVVAGTHMSHLIAGSPVQFSRLRRAVSARVGGGLGVLAGDMNLWGPPTVALLPGWRRAVRGRTWPAWRPHSQPDHILVRGGLEVVSGAVVPSASSDHRPVRAVLRVPGSSGAAESS